MAGNATELLVQRMRRARRITVPLSPTPQAPADAAPKRIFLLRPLEEQALAMMHAKSVTIDDVCRHADGWEGITQADLLGPELGSQDEAVDFAPEIFSEFVRDRADLMAELVTRLAEAINAHFARRADTAKN